MTVFARMSPAKAAFAFGGVFLVTSTLLHVVLLGGFDTFTLNVAAIATVSYWAGRADVGKG